MEHSGKKYRCIYQPNPMEWRDKLFSIFMNGDLDPTGQQCNHFSPYTFPIKHISSQNIIHNSFLTRHHFWWPWAKCNPNIEQTFKCNLNVCLDGNFLYTKFHENPKIQTKVIELISGQLDGCPTVHPLPFANLNKKDIVQNLVNKPAINTIFICSPNINNACYS